MVGILSEYLGGAYMNYRDPAGFFWDRPISDRGVIELTPGNVARANTMFPPVSFTLRVNHAVEAVLRDLSDPNIKRDTWIRAEAVDVYGRLLEQECLQTYEVYREGELAGAVLGIPVFPMFVADTMYWKPPYSGASKAALSGMVLCLSEAGYGFVDTQVVHRQDHPAARLGEVAISYQDFRVRTDRIRENLRSYGAKL